MITKSTKVRVFGLLAVSFGTACGGAPKQAVVTSAAPTPPKVKTASDYAQDGLIALEGGNYAAAVKAYDAVLAKDRQNLGATYNRAYALHQLGDLDAAQAGYAAVLEQDPRSSDAAVNLGAILKEKGEPDRAIQVIERALEKDPFNGPLLNNLSVLQREQGNHKAAIEAVRTLLKRDKDNVDAYKNLSLVYFDQKKYKLSQTILENALKMSKEQGREDPDIYVNLGMIYLAKEKNGKAMAAFKKAKSLQPDHTVANYNIGALALGHRDYGLAAESYATVSKSWKDNYDVVVGHGYALQGQRKLQEAASRLEQARTLLAKMPTTRTGEEEQILLQLTIIYQDAEEPKKALQYADEYLRLKKLTCTDEDFDGFCGRYNGIQYMLNEVSEPPPEEEKREAKDASESTIFTEGDDEVPVEEGEEAETPPETEAPPEG